MALRNTRHRGSVPDPDRPDPESGIGSDVLDGTRGGDKEQEQKPLAEDNEKNRKLVRRLAKKWNAEVEAMRAEANLMAKEIRKELKNAGIAADDFHLARHFAELEEQVRKRRYTNLALCLNALGTPIQGALFDPAE